MFELITFTSWEICHLSGIWRGKPWVGMKASMMPLYTTECLSTSVNPLSELHCKKTECDCMWTQTHFYLRHFPGKHENLIRLGTNVLMYLFSCRNTWKYVVKPLTCHRIKLLSKGQALSLFISYFLSSFILRINLLFYLYFPPSSHPTFVCFFPVDLSLLIEHFQQVL